MGGLEKMVDALIFSAWLLCAVAMIIIGLVLLIQELGFLVVGIMAGVVVAWLVLAFALYLIVEE
jgi:hypothetical protein